MSIPGSFMTTPLHWQTIHFKGITANNEKFVYCPLGNIISWAPGDYDHEWCHFCQVFYTMK